MTELRDRAQVHESSQVFCGVVFAQAQSHRSGQQIGNVTTLDHSQAWVGMPASVVGKINQRIGNVRTEASSKAHVGVFSGEINM